MDDRCITCGHPDCRLEPGGWCPAHGWTCGDHHEDPVAVAAGSGSAGGAGPEEFEAQESGVWV